MKSPKTIGFTIVELLIVIVIIAILATLVIVAYTGIQNRAYDTSVKTDLANFGKKIEIAKAESSNDLYPVAGDIASTTGIKFNKPSYSTGVHNLAYCRSNDGLEYALVAVSKSGAQYFYSSTKGLKTYDFAWTSAAATTCPNVVNGNYVNSWGYSMSVGWTWAN